MFERIVGDPTISADPIDEVKAAHALGIPIARIEIWFHSSRSGKTETTFFAAVPVKYPRWTARDGYCISRLSEYWLKQQAQAFYGSRL